MKKNLIKKKKRKSTSKSFLLRNYENSFKYLKESKIFIYSAVMFFFFFVLFAVIIPAPVELEKIIFDFVGDLLEQTEGLSHFELIKFIFFNNLQSAFFGIVFGIVFGIFPLVSIVLNGYLVGFVSARSVQIGGIFVLLNLLPHGLFELPALFISVGLGFKLGTFIFRKEIIKSLKIYLIESIRTFILIVIPLLLIAAIIEGTFIFLMR